MVPHDDGVAGEVAVDELAQPQAGAPFVHQRQAQHLVEVAVVDEALPVHGDKRAAHHLLEVLVAVRAAQERHVRLELAFGDEHGAKALDRHVGERVEAVEHHAAARELALVVRFERLLRRRQRGPLRVVDKIQHEAALGDAITERVQLAQGRDAALVDALAALALDEL